MPIPASIVKGTPFEERVKGPGVEERVAIMDKMGIDVAGDQRQRLLVVGHQGPGARARHLPAPQRHARQGGARLPGPHLRHGVGPAAVSGAGGRDAAGRGQERRARRDRWRPRPEREPVGAAIRSVLGEGRRDERAGVHASERLRQHHQGGRPRRARRPRQHRRQPARDDGVPLAADFRRHLRQVPDAEGGGRARRRVPALVPGTHRSRVPAAGTELHHQEEAERLHEAEHHRRHDGVLRTKACGISSPRWASARWCSARTSPSTGR